MLVKCTASFLSAKIPVTSVNDTVNIRHSGLIFLPPHRPSRTHPNDLQTAFVQVQNKWLTLSFGFAIQHVLLSLLGGNIIVQAVEKILLIVYFLVAVTRNNRRGDEPSQPYFSKSCSYK